MGSAIVVDAVVCGADGKLRARGTATFAADTEGHVMADGRPLAGFSAFDVNDVTDVNE